MVWHGYARRRCNRMWALEGENIDTPGGVVMTFVCRRLAGSQTGRDAWRCNHTMRVRGALGRARAGRSDAPEDGCVCATARAAGRAGVPPGHKKRAARAALENHEWKIRRHSGVCRCQCSISRSRSLSGIIGTGVSVKPSGVR